MLPWQGGRFRSREEGFGDVVDIGQVAQLVATPDLEWLVLQHAADPDAEEGLARIADAQARAVTVGQAQADHRTALHAVLSIQYCSPANFETPLASGGATGCRSSTGRYCGLP